MAALLLQGHSSRVDDDPASTRSSRGACQARATPLSTLSLKARTRTFRCPGCSCRDPERPRLATDLHGRTSGRIVELEPHRAYVHAGILHHFAELWVFKERVRVL